MALFNVFDYDTVPHGAGLRGAVLCRALSCVA